MKDDVKVFKTILVGVCFMAFLSSCARDESVNRQIMGGMYEGMKIMEETKYGDPTLMPVKQIPSYDQYERERREMIIEKYGNER